MDTGNLETQIETFEKYLDSLHLDSLNTPQKGLHLISLFEEVSDVFKQQMWSRVPPLLNQKNPSSPLDRQWIRWIWKQTFLLFQTPQVQKIDGDFDQKGYTLDIQHESIPLSLKTELLNEIQHTPNHHQETLVFSFKLLHALQYWGIYPQSKPHPPSFSHFQTYQKWTQRLWHRELTRTAKGIRIIESHLNRPLYFTEDPQQGWDFEMLLFTLLNGPWKPPQLEVDLAPWERDLLGAGDVSIRLNSSRKSSLKGWLQVSLSAEASINERKQNLAIKKGCFWLLSPWTLAQDCPPQHPFWKTQSHLPQTLQGRAYLIREIFLRGIKKAKDHPWGPLVIVPYPLILYIIDRIIHQLKTVKPHTSFKIKKVPLLPFPSQDLIEDQ